MSNKFFNKQVTTKQTGAKSSEGHGESLKTPWHPSPDVMPGLPGKAGSYPCATGEFEVASIYPVSEGLDG